MSGTTNCATTAKTDELTAALTRRLTAYLSERDAAPTAILHDRLRSGMFFVLYMASVGADMAEDDDERLIAQALTDRAYVVFAAAERVTNAMWREATLQSTCDA